MNPITGQPHRLERQFLREAGRYLRGRPVEARLLVRWFLQYAARARVDRWEVSAQEMLGIALGPREGLPWGLVIKRRQSLTRV